MKYQHFHSVKRQTCFNCGIAGHIARNCVHSPRVQQKNKNAPHRKVTPNRSRYSESVTTAKSETVKNNFRKAKPSDQDWNAAQGSNQNRQHGFQCTQPKVFGKYQWSQKHWKPKNKAAQSSTSKQQKSANPESTKFLNKENLVWQRVTYLDAQGKPRSTMGWVPKSN